jgi:hypothetical protein
LYAPRPVLAVIAVGEADAIGATRLEQNQSLSTRTESMPPPTVYISRKVAEARLAVVIKCRSVGWAAGADDR